MMQMSVLYNQFCITDILPDLKTKTIVITTNFKVDASTINLNTVSLYDYSAGNGQLADYTLYVDGKSICIILKDFPGPGTKYYLKVTEIYDALNRKINYAYNDYIVFDNDVITDVEIITPGYRETFTQNIIDIKLKVKDSLADGLYKIQVSSDNTFFKSLAVISCSAVDKTITSEDESLITISESEVTEEFITLKACVNYNGQVYMRARAERSDHEVGRWSNLQPFTINTIPADSMDTTFLDQSLTTFDLFDDLNTEPLSISKKESVVNIEDEMFFLEFNKEIALPEDYELTEDGYVCLGTIIGFRKELK
jgi:hypothetical protein